jgi:urease accessory protein UreF
MSTVAEIEAALERLPVQEAQSIARWLQEYLEHQNETNTAAASPTRLRLPDYAARRQMIFGDKVLPNMVLLGREQERW